MRQIISELKRRNIFRVAGVYVVVSWIIIQIAVAVEAPLSLPGWTDTMVIILLALGLPVSMVFTWAFEITPDGIRRTRAEKTDAPKPGLRVTDWALALLIIVLIGVSARPYFAPTGSATTDLATLPPSIAVLPFADMSPDKDQEYFSDGISEEILNVLAKTSGLQVAARTSSFSFKGQDDDIRKIGELLDVAHVLEGSVRKFGNRVRITAQLIRADNGYHLWSETYDRDLKDIFALQDEISAQILGAMKVHLLNEQPRSHAVNENLEAYDYYLRGKHLQAKRVPEAIEEAANHFEKAIALSPQFPEAHAALAQNYMLMRNGITTYGEMTDEQARTLAGPHVKLAQSLAPDLPEAHALVYFMADTEKEKRAGLTRALELNPNYSEALAWRALLNMQHGRPGDARADLERARKTDPLSLLININLANLYLELRLLDEARTPIETLRAIAPESRQTKGILHRLSIVEGNYAEAVARALNMVKTRTYTIYTLYWLNGYLPAINISTAPLYDAYEVNGKAFWKADEAWNNGDLDLALSLTRKHFKSSKKEDPFSTVQYAGLLFMHGEQQQARALVESMLARGNEQSLPPCLLHSQVLFVGMQFEEALKTTGELCAKMFSRPPEEMSWEKSQTGFAYFAVRGETEAAIALLENAVKKGAPLLHSSYRLAIPYVADHPKLAGLLSTLEQRAAALRTEVLDGLARLDPELHAQLMLADTTVH
ncbi:tetratricopeptide repeat protein [Biformimicrobium ophioploci]|uniref:Tetratricopeptide repeat protein n=1 Tax=Biformimicrobium ophioploci TaxID=3036711 RepID=A0ABQ6LWW6_9GAMM|nr:tetratricopeptide repeat protein [Microbulbifer sp. NKW57]GMG86512.1 hypothetical protein MNKW57_08330 [Microbulbifer sp. NKW57]